MCLFKSWIFQHLFLIVVWLQKFSSLMLNSNQKQPSRYSKKCKWHLTLICIHAVHMPQITRMFCIKPLPCWFSNITYLICLCISTVTHNFHYSSCKYFTMNKIHTADDLIISQTIFSWILKYTFWINSNLHPMGHLHRETRSGFPMFMSEEDNVHCLNLFS